MEPSDEELAAAVEAACAGREDLEQDAAALTRALADDHFLWKIRAQRVQEILDAREAAKLPARKVPSELFEFDWATAVPWKVAKMKTGTHLRVEGIHHAQGGLGSLGCYLIKLADPDGVVVLKQKPVYGVAHELAANELLRSVGVSVPAMRVLDESELDDLIFELRDAPVTAHGTCDEIHAPRFREAGAVLMDFVPGSNLEDEPLAARDAGTLAEEDWRVLGAILVVDAIINNSDRVPSIWRSDGNSGNLIVDGRRRKGTRVVAIDQTVSVIKNESMREKYFARVGDLLGAASLDRVSAFLDLEGALGPELAASALEQLCRGARTAISQLRRDASSLVSSAVDVAAAEAHEAGFDVEAAEDFLLGAIAALPEGEPNSTSARGSGDPVEQQATKAQDGEEEEEEEEGMLEYILSLCGLTAADEPDGGAPGSASTSTALVPATVVAGGNSS